MSAQVQSDTREPDLDSLLHDIQALEAIVDGWTEQQRNTVDALRRSIDDLHREAIVRLIRGVSTEPEAARALKSLLGDEVVYAVLRHLGVVRASLQERVEAALESVRPMLASHGGNVELVDVQPPDRVEIRLTGACDGCPASGLTLSEGIEKAIRAECPEIRHIDKARGGPRAAESPIHFVSPFARAGDSGWLRAAAFDELPDGGVKLATVGGRSVLLSRVGDKPVCYENACAHLGMPLDMGEVRDGVLVCPHHRFEYLLESGECLTAAEVQLHAHAVRIVDGQVEVKLL